MEKLKCSKCAHFYRTMAGPEGIGYNPAPFCHCYEDTGKPATILTQECFRPIPQRKAKDTKREC